MTAYPQSDPNAFASGRGLRNIRTSASVVALVLLAGCSWTGETFYTEAEAQAAIAPGNYRTNESEHPAPDSLVRISVLPNGLTRFELTERGDTVAGFAPLGADGRFSILWLTRFDGHDLPAEGTLYALLERRPAGQYRIYVPDCSRDRAEAVAAGATPNGPGGNADCVFHDRASLEAGMRAYARHPFDGMDLIPVP